MSLALKVKKFINSEHSGEYVDIILPGEIGINSAAGVKLKPKKESDAPAEAEDAASFDPDDPMDEENEGETHDINQGTMQQERCRIHYMEAGMGEPLLLIHTVGQSLYTWRGVFNLLSARYRVIAIDLPGFGYSDRPENFSFSVEDYAEVIARFMDAKGIESAHIAAFSLGGAYAVSFALRHPERMGRLALLSPGGITPEMPLTIRMIDSPLFGFIASMLYNMNAVAYAFLFKIIGNGLLGLCHLHAVKKAGVHHAPMFAFGVCFLADVSARNYFYYWQIEGLCKFIVARVVRGNGHYCARTVAHQDVVCYPYRNFLSVYRIYCVGSRKNAGLVFGEIRPVEVAL